ncbi:MAG TPA: carboxypeptidase-like regulatory domain-containing protein, partial [Puia sp.]|nr:carboxypeptidase-like regulatory domain-containing protein [Puia sp.]
MRNLIILIFLVIGIYASAQSPLISGRITNAKGEPVSFATVRVKGAKTTVAADVDGAFKIKANPGQTLLITAATYSPSEVLVQNQSDLSISLNLQQGALSEVVVTALGQSKSKAKLGYSTASFNSEAITRASPISMLDGLQGKIAGADISALSGTPGSSTKVI